MAKKENDKNEEFVKMGEALNGLEPVSEDDLPPLLNPKNGQCVHCKKLLSSKEMVVLDSGITKVLEQLCSECRDTFKDQAKVACVKCKEIILWVDPHKEKTGFEFVKNKIYHVKNCPTCKSDLTSAQILEKVVYFEANNIPYE